MPHRPRHRQRRAQHAACRNHEFRNRWPHGRVRRAQRDEKELPERRVWVLELLISEGTLQLVFEDDGRDRDSELGEGDYQYGAEEWGEADLWEMHGVLIPRGLEKRLRLGGRLPGRRAGLSVCIRTGTLEDVLRPPRAILSIL